MLADDAEWCLTSSRKSSLNDPTYSGFGHGLPAYESEIQRVEKTGGQVWIATLGYLPGTTERKRAFEHSGRALVMDVDVGAPKPKAKAEVEPYATATEALRTIFALINDGKMLLPSMIVGSGYGVHLWYRLDTALPPPEWHALAGQWKEHHVQFSRLAVDSTRWGDGGLLRPIGTFNLKHGDRKPVRALKGDGPSYSVQEVQDWLAAQGAAPKPVKAPRVPVGTGVLAQKPDHLKGKPGKQTAPLQEHSPLELITSGCAAIRDYRENLQPTASEPQWRVMCHLAHFTVEGREAAHTLSVGHPEYSPEDTNAKFDSAGKAGPLGCDAVRTALYGSDRVTGTPCEGCPMADRKRWAHQFDVANPINRARLDLARSVAAAAMLTPPAPLPAPIGAWTPVQKADDINTVAHAAPTIPSWLLSGGDIPYHIDSATGALISQGGLVCTPGFWVVSSGGKDNRHMLEIAKRVVRNGTLQVAVFPHDAKGFADKTSALKALTSNGINVLPTAHSSLMTYINYARTQAADAMYFDAMGYQPDEHVYVIGKTAIDGNGRFFPIKLTGSAEKEAGNYVAKGTLQDAIKHVQMYAESGSNEARFALLAGFGANLMHMTGKAGAVVHLYGKPSTGKTSLQATIAGLFGRPNAEQVSGAAKDTEKSVFTKIGARNTLATCYDEVTSLGKDRLGAFVYAVTTGRTGSGNTKENELRENGLRWSTLIISSANNSIQAEIAGRSAADDAKRRRALEIKVDATLKLPDLLGVREHGEQNFGVVGFWFMQHVMQNYDQIKGRIGPVRDHVRLLTGGTQLTELYTEVAAVVYLAGQVLIELGAWTCPVSLDEIVGSVVRDAVAAFERNETEPMELLHEYIAASATSGIVVADSGKPGRARWLDRTPADHLVRSPVALRTEINSNCRTIYIPERLFRVHLQRAYGPETTVEDVMRKLTTRDLVRGQSLGIKCGPDTRVPWRMTVDMVDANSGRSQNDNARGIGVTSVPCIAINVALADADADAGNGVLDKAVGGDNIRTLKTERPS